MSLNGDDLVPDELEDAIHDRLKALQYLLIRECHVSILDGRFWKLGFDTNIYGPLLAVVTEVGFYPVLEIHYAFRVDSTSRSRAIWELHLANLGAKDCIGHEGAQTRLQMAR